MRFVVPMILLAIFAVATRSLPTAAQEMMDDKPVVCDSTLVTLLLVAEHDYGYLSSMDSPGVDLGQYGPLIKGIMTMGEMMQEMEKDDLLSK